MGLYKNPQEHKNISRKMRKNVKFFSFFFGNIFAKAGTPSKNKNITNL
jgi:hypothetical protein